MARVPADIAGDVDELNDLGRGMLPGHLGIDIRSWSDGELTAVLPIRRELFAPNGFVHAASLVALADTLCGYGCVTTLPEGASGFTTVELKANFLGAAREGALSGRAVRVHAGRSTQIWDATITADNGDTVALFRCTQLILWPR
jgi:uncharacterized protein (TIGR00369 family)